MGLLNQMVLCRKMTAGPRPVRCRYGYIDLLVNVQRGFDNQPTIQIGHHMATLPPLACQRSGSMLLRIRSASSWPRFLLVMIYLRS